MAFRFSSIERLPEPPSPHTAKGTLVHRALELLLGRPPDERLAATAHACIEQAAVELREHEEPAERELAQLELSADEEAAFVADAHTLMDTYLALEDPQTVARPSGLSSGWRRRSAGCSCGASSTGWRRTTTASSSSPTTRPAGPRPVHYEQRRLGGRPLLRLPVRAGARPPARRHPAHVPAGRRSSSRPARPSARSASCPSARRRSGGPSSRACETGDFKPRPGRLCPSCAFQDWCPAFGGDPDRAALEAPVRYGRGPGAAPAGRRRRAAPGAAAHDYRYASSARDVRRLDRALRRRVRRRVSSAPWPPGQRSHLPDRVGARRLVASIWHLVGAGWGLTSDRRTDRAAADWPCCSAPSRSSSTRASSGCSARTRPTHAGDARHPVRRPAPAASRADMPARRSSRASLLSEGDRELTPLWFALAAVVVDVPGLRRIHHASDVVAGAAVGLALAAVARRLWPQP